MRVSRTLISLALFGAIGSHALAQGAFDAAAGEAAPRSRAEVREAARAAVAAGAIPRGEATQDLPQRFVSIYSRAQVNAQAVAALAAGRIAHGEVTPDHSANFVSTKTRPQVLAEAREATRLGLIARGEAAIPIPTAAQRHSIRSAGLRARGDHGALAAR